MREILFHGKRIDNGEWVEGGLDTDWEIPHEERHRYFISIPYYDAVQVDPATVGQYTGLADKHGVKIFEGDIVHCISQYDNANMAVIFEDGEFRMVFANKLPEYETGMGFFAIYCFDKEVIGNIHDTEDTPCTE